MSEDLEKSEPAVGAVADIAAASNLSNSGHGQCSKWWCPDGWGQPRVNVCKYATVGDVG